MTMQVGSRVQRGYTVGVGSCSFKEKCKLHNIAYWTISLCAQDTICMSMHWRDSTSGGDVQHSQVL